MDLSDKRQIINKKAYDVIVVGGSWPFDVIKSYKARTTKGKNLAFLLLIFFVYIAGITSKFLNEVYMASFSEKWYVLFFYILNLVMDGRTHRRVFGFCFKTRIGRDYRQILKSGQTRICCF